MKILRDFWIEHKDSEQALRSWYSVAKKAVWKTPTQIKDKYRHFSIIGNNRGVFNICGNKYRLVVAIKYDFEIVFIRFVGTHKDYDKIDVERI